MGEGKNNCFCMLLWGLNGKTLEKKKRCFLLSGSKRCFFWALGSRQTEKKRIVFVGFKEAILLGARKTCGGFVGENLRGWCCSVRF